MKVLVIHNFYTHTTGEDLSVKETTALLKKSERIDLVEYYKHSKSFLFLTSAPRR